MVVILGTTVVTGINNSPMPPLNFAGTWAKYLSLRPSTTQGVLGASQLGQPENEDISKSVIRKYFLDDLDTSHRPVVKRRRIPDS